MAKSYDDIKKILSSSTPSQLMSLRQHGENLKAPIIADKVKADPVNTVVENMAREGQDTGRHLQSVIQPTKLSAPVELRARREAEQYLGTTDTPHVDIKNFGVLQPLDNNTDAGTIDSDQTRIENNRLKELQDDYLGNDIYRTEGGFSNGATNESQDRLLDKYQVLATNLLGSKAGSMVKECIPCGVRKFNLKDIQFSDVLANTLDDLKKKLEDLRRLLDSLFLGNQAEMDLCDLLSLLEAQCLPDLFGMLSLLGIMQMKYLNTMQFNMKGALNSIIAPFLSPIIGPLVHNLERYVDMIIDPLICVVEALETQMYKITSIDPKAQMDAYRYSYNRRKIDFYNSKINSLNKRKEDIQLAESTGNVTEDGDQQFPRYTRMTPFPDGPNPSNIKGANEEEGFVRNTLASLKTLSNPREANQVEVEPKLLGSFRQSLGAEKVKIDEDIEQAREEIANLTRENQRIGVPKNEKNSYEASKKAKEFKKNIQSSIYQMTLGLNEGIQGIRDTLEMYRIELERTITGRVQTQEDLIELTRNLQQIQRWISIINALIKLKQSNGSLTEICKRGSSSDALGAFVGEFKNQPSGSSMDFYKATDNEGNELMVVVPGGATVNLTSIEFEDLGSDALLGEATLDDVQNIATFNDLGEADKLNRKGVLLDIGNITGKDLTVSLNDAGANKTELDLRAERSYVIIKNDFCSKSPFKTGTSDTIRKWAENIL